MTNHDIIYINRFYHINRDLLYKHHICDVSILSNKENLSEYEDSSSDKKGMMENNIFFLFKESFRFDQIYLKIHS